MSVTASPHADHRALAWHAFLWDPWFLSWGVLVTIAMVASRRRDNGCGGIDVSPHMNSAMVLEVIDRLVESGIAVWIDGGWGVDALVGQQTRPHTDLDLVIAQADCSAGRAALEPLGYAHDTTIEPSSLGPPPDSCCATAVPTKSTFIRSSSTIAAAVGNLSATAPGPPIRRKDSPESARSREAASSV